MGLGIAIALHLPSLKYSYHLEYCIQHNVPVDTSIGSTRKIFFKK